MSARVTFTGGKGEVVTFAAEIPSRQEKGAAKPSNMVDLNDGMFVA